MPSAINEQKEIVAWIKRESTPLDQAVQQAVAEISLIREYRDRLIADVVTGQIDVRGWTPGPDDVIDDADLAALSDPDSPDEALEDEEVSDD